MRKQRGVTLTGFIIISVIVIFGLLLAFKVGPAYFEYYKIQKQFKALAADPVVRSGSSRDLGGAWVARATMENITSIGGGDIIVTREGNEVVLSAQYSKQVHLVGNLSACMDFAPTSADH